MNDVGNAINLSGSSRILEHFEKTYSHANDSDITVKGYFNTFDKKKNPCIHTKHYITSILFPRRIT